MRALALIAAATAVVALTACPPPPHRHRDDGDGRRCGGYAGRRCGPDQFCDLPEGRCRAADLEGVCVNQTRACTRDYRPVCGCDGKTYGNDCSRRAAAAQKAHDGECRTARREVRVVGCPYRGVEGGCLMIDGQGTTYDISAATPPPKVGQRAISLTGRESGHATTCQQGTPLTDIHWSYTKHRCPRGKKKR